MPYLQNELCWRWFCYGFEKKTMGSTRGRNNASGKTVTVDWENQGPKSNQEGSILAYLKQSVVESQVYDGKVLNKLSLNS